MFRRVGRLARLLGVLIAALGLVTLASCSTDDSGASSKSGKSGKTSGGEGAAPDFKLDSLDGKTVELASLKGKIVVIDFWATWCPPCRITLPLVNKVYEQTRGKDVEVYGISTDRVSSQRVKEFVKQNKISMPILHDRNGTVSMKYGVRGIPTMFIIDRDGNIRDKHVGGDPSLDKKVLKEIEELLEK